MDTLQLQNYIKEDQLVSRYFRGIFPKDLLSQTTEYPSLYIVNHDTSEKAGSHWIVLFVQNEAITEYFDPLGNIPDKYIANYMMVQSKTFMYNVKRCQNFRSNLCGQYCLFYCYFRSRGYLMQDILSMFNEKDLEYNDQLVYYFYKYTKIT